MKHNLKIKLVIHFVTYIDTIAPIFSNYYTLNGTVHEYNSH